MISSTNPSNPRTAESSGSLGAASRSANAVDRQICSRESDIGDLLASSGTGSTRAAGPPPSITGAVGGRSPESARNREGRPFEPERSPRLDHLAGVDPSRLRWDSNPFINGERPRAGRRISWLEDRGADYRGEAEWVRSERASYRIALAIALAPIPIALLISWALGDLPWRSRTRPGDRGRAGTYIEGPERPGLPTSTRPPLMAKGRGRSGGKAQARTPGGPIVGVVRESPGRLGRGVLSRRFKSSPASGLAPFGFTRQVSTAPR